MGNHGGSGAAVVYRHGQRMRVAAKYGQACFVDRPGNIRLEGSLLDEGDGTEPKQ